MKGVGGEGWRGGGWTRGWRWELRLYQAELVNRCYMQRKNNLLEINLNLGHIILTVMGKLETFTMERDSGIHEAEYINSFT